MAKKRQPTDEQSEGFLARLDPVRIIIYILVLAILVFAGFLGYSEWQISKYREGYQLGYNSQLPSLFKEYWQVKKLQNEIEASGNDPKAPFNTVVEDAAGVASMDMIQDQIQTGRETELTNRREKYTNVTRRLDIGDRKRGAERQRIFWVLFHIQNNPKYSITKLELVAKTLSDDRWTAVANVTNRETASR